MATVAQLRAALAANLAAITDTQVSAYMLAQPTPPVIQVYPDEVEFDGAMRRGMDTWRFVIQAFVGAVSDIGSQKRLDAMLDPASATSVKDAAESDPTLGGFAQDIRVVGASGYRVYQLEGRPAVLGCEWRVDVIARGD